MTTRLEADLRDIEDRIARPKKGQLVTPNEVEHVRIQREREKARDARTKDIGKVIKCSWVDTPLDDKGEPVKYETASAIVEIGGNSLMHLITPRKEIEGKERLDPALVNLGYRGVVQKWATWKWHILRGSEVDDADNFVLDCDPPKFEWASLKTK